MLASDAVETDVRLLGVDSLAIRHPLGMREGGNQVVIEVEPKARPSLPGLSEDGRTENVRNQMQSTCCEMGAGDVSNVGLQ